MIDYLKELFSQNQTLAAVYSGGLVAALVMHSRSIFQILSRCLLNIISFDIINVSRDVGYYNDDIDDNFTIFLQNQKPIFSRNYEVKHNGKIGTGFGTQWYLVFGKITSVNREIETSNGTMLLRTSIRVFFANKNKFMNKLKEVIVKPTNIYENKVKIFFQYQTNKREKRPLNTIYIKNNEQYKILNDLKKFISSKDFYIKNNISYKRNYLFYGKPGTGKTSLIFSLASELNYDIKIIDLGAFNDLQSLLYQIYNCSPNTFLVFEDIDAMSNNFENRADNNDKPVKNNELPLPPPNKPKELSLSILLNLLDGLYTKEGMISFFTTNHVEKLDPAFLRDGRMDYKFEMSDLDNKTANLMIYNKTGLKNIFNKKFINPASLQELIIKFNFNNISKNEFIKILNDRNE